MQLSCQNTKHSEQKSLLLGFKGYIVIMSNFHIHNSTYKTDRQKAEDLLTSSNSL